MCSSDLVFLKDHCLEKDVKIIVIGTRSEYEDVEKLLEIGADAVLIGETLIRAEDKKAKLTELRGAV